MTRLAFSWSLALACAAALALLAVLALLPLGREQSRRRQSSLAGDGGRLAPCPGTPNCVSTEDATPAASMLPIPFRDAPEEAQHRARAALLAEPRLRIVAERPGYLRAEARSRALRFVDDVEIAIDADARLIRFRAAARLGRRDFGVNRARMARVSERLRTR